MQKAKVKTESEKRHHDVGKRSYNFSLEIVKLITSFPNKRVYWVFADQLLRSATSVGANIVEARGSSSKKEFARYYGIAFAVLTKQATGFHFYTILSLFLLKFISH